MKTDIHPDYQEATITCSCGNTFQTRSTGGDFRVELCNECHPFYTGRQKLVDSGGRIDRFNKRYGDGVKSKKAQKKSTEAPAEEAATEEA